MTLPPNTPNAIARPHVLSACLVSACLVSASLVSACASPPRQSEASAPKASGSSADDGTSADPSAAAPAETQPGVAAEGKKDCACNEAAPSRALQTAPEEERNFDEGDSSPAPKASPALSETRREKKKDDLLSQLRLQSLDLDESLQPEILSCDGARPLKDAICSIAGRICEMEAPSTARSPDCSQAQESCEKARRDYKAKCS